MSVVFIQKKKSEDRKRSDDVTFRCYRYRHFSALRSKEEAGQRRPREGGSAGPNQESEQEEDTRMEEVPASRWIREYISSSGSRERVVEEAGSTFKWFPVIVETVLASRATLEAFSLPLFYAYLSVTIFIFSDYHKTPFPSLPKNSPSVGHTS